MPQNERVEALSSVDFERHCEKLALQILRSGVTYDWAMVLLSGAHGVWTYLREVIPFKKVYYVRVTRYPDGETQSRQPPEFTDFPRHLAGVGIIIDDCVDDADTMFETITRSLKAGAQRVDSAVVLCKTANIKICDPDTGQKFHPTYVGWDDAPGGIFYDFPREAFKKRVMAAFLAERVEAEVST